MVEKEEGTVRAVPAKRGGDPVRHMGAHEEGSRGGQDMQKLGESHQGGVLKEETYGGGGFKGVLQHEGGAVRVGRGALPTRAHADPRDAEETCSGRMGWHSSSTGRTSCCR